LSTAPYCYSKLLPVLRIMYYSSRKYGISQGSQMSQILICDVCGAKIEIEDSEDMLSVTDSKIRDEENVPDAILCENCRQNSSFENFE
jgi:hypothetical protein